MRLRIDARGRRGPARTLLVLAAAAGLAFSMGLLMSASAGALAPRCATSNLRVDKVGEDDFTSHRSWDLALRNIGSGTCRLKGYPGVRLLDSGARIMSTTVIHTGGAQPTVTLAPWHRAFFTFTFATNGPCTHAVFAYGVRVVPPGASPRLVQYEGIFGLCGPSPARVTVSPVGPTKPF